MTDSAGVLEDPSSIDAHGLAERLRASGSLVAGSVDAVTVEPVDGTWSRLARLRVRYAPGSTGALPDRLLLKCCTDGVFGPSEVRFHTRDYVDLEDAPLPRCHHAAYDEGPPRRYHVLLEDLSRTHHTPREMQPTPALADGLAASLARLHAHRWGAVRMAGLGLGAPAVGEFRRWTDRVGAGLEPMLAAAGSLVSSKRAATLRRMFVGLAEARAARIAAAPGWTLVHGDLNPGNILLPRAPGAGAVKFIDRQPFDWSLTRWLGVSDILHVMVLWWAPEARRSLEKRTLDRYHHGLIEEGVRDYDEARMREDVRACLVDALSVVTEWCIDPAERQRMRPLWTRHLGRVLEALDDHGVE